MPSTIKKAKRVDRFTQISNIAIRDKRLNPNGLAVLTYLDMVEKMVGSINPDTGKPYQITKKEIAERFGQKRCDNGWLNLINSGYLISFKRYNSNKNEYNYVFDDMKFEELESGEFDLLTEFKSQFEEGYIWFSSMIAQPKNRTKAMIAASLPSNISDEERETLAQWIWERIPQAQSSNDDQVTQQLALFDEFKDNQTPVSAKATPMTADEKLNRLDQEIDQDLPDYQELFKDVDRRLPKTSDLYAVKRAVFDKVMDLQVYFDFENPQYLMSQKPSPHLHKVIDLDTGEILGSDDKPVVYWSYNQAQRQFITRLVQRQLDITTQNLKNINKFDDYFITGLTNLIELTIQKLANGLELDF